MKDDNRHRILPECYVETTVCEVLLRLGDRNFLNKKSGVGSVANEFYTNPNSKAKRITKANFFDSPALGVIDLDKIKNDASDFFRDKKNFNVISNDGSLTLIRHKEKNYHYAILVDPAMEMFLIKCAKVAKVTVNEYGFVKELESLKEVTKSRNLREDVNFKNFVKLLVKREVPEVLTLQNWLQQFYKNLKIEV